MKKHKQKPAVVISMTLLICLVMFTASIFILAYVMTKKDIEPSACKAYLLILCAVFSALASFIVSKKQKLNPVIIILISALLFSAAALLPVLVVSGENTGLQALLIPVICFISSFAGAVAGRKI